MASRRRAGADIAGRSVQLVPMESERAGGAVVRCGRWAAVSAGEYDRRTGCITVNLTVVDAVHAAYGHTPDCVAAAIVAHERAHASASRDLPLAEDEARARAAAVAAGGAIVVAHIDDVLAGGVW